MNTYTFLHTYKYHLVTFLCLRFFPVVEWSQVIYLQPLLHLRSIVIFDNPACSKPKINEFISALCGQHLHLLNGRKVESRDFFKTADGRVMLTQARATLTSDQRNGLTLGNSLNKK